MKEQSFKGTISEFTASVWLLKQGCMVFKNIMPCGPFDLIAIKGNESIKIDVKTLTMCKMYQKSVINRIESETRLVNGIKTLYCESNGNCIWYEDLIKLFPAKRIRKI